MTDSSIDPYVDSVESWRRDVETRLRAANGWLALAGLFWLHEGQNRIGTDPHAEVVLPRRGVSEHAGIVELFDGRAVLRVMGDGKFTVEGAPRREIELRPDVDDTPTFVEIDDLRMVLIRRSTRYGIRVWDNRRAERRTFPGRLWFPVDPAWRIRAAYSPYQPPRTLPVPSILGDEDAEVNPGRVSFSMGGSDHTLEALEGDDGGLFLVFADDTNRDLTYPAGRFLKTDRPGNDGVILDFNRAYNPPCAFTPFATCPLPPHDNRLTLRIEAGELRPDFHPEPHSSRGD
ncbi:MAG TPA: DUF1684 domain-containing protein [Anaerolineales bacterium]|nr:DUF1684 domain-containing protein [Anaerolineales bacterium]